MDDQKTYVCLGTCQGVVTEEQYKNGLHACGAKGCDLKGHPFVPGRKNPKTGKTEAIKQ
jgi:hypothetical protein